MQRLGGLLLILAGVSLGAYTFLPAPFDNERSLREVTRISAAPGGEDLGHASWLAWGDQPAQETEIPKTIQGTLPPAQAASPVKPDKVASNEQPAATWSAIVMAGSSEQARITSSKPGDGETRAQLARDLQTELKRVGCYAGEITGSWTPSTKRAMATFMERVNATLPVEEPDYILLTMVQGHSNIACGAGCPAGQTTGTDGRCMPQGVIAARNAKKAKSEQTVALSKHAQPTLEDSTRRDSEHDQRIAAVEGDERLPWLSDDLSTPVPPAPIRVIRRPEGMMAVGAATPSEVPQEAQPVTSPQGAHKNVSIEPVVRDAPRRKVAAPVLGYQGAEPGLPGAKAGAAATRAKSAGIKPGKKKSLAVKRPQAFPPYAAKTAKPKFLYYAGSGRRGIARPGSPAFNMLQAMGGVF